MLIFNFIMTKWIFSSAMMLANLRLFAFALEKRLFNYFDAGIFEGNIVRSNKNNVSNKLVQMKLTYHQGYLN